MSRWAGSKTGVDVAVGVSRALHARGLVKRVFGRPVPILVHELEYYDEIVQQTRAANPPGLVKGFARWVHGFS
jgi:hypothetical protein